jgi:hypothetical protein
MPIPAIAPVESPLDLSVAIWAFPRFVCWAVPWFVCVDERIVDPFGDVEVVTGLVKVVTDTVDVDFADEELSADVAGDDAEGARM